MLADGAHGAGRHVVTWDGTGDDGEQVPSGHYFYELRAGEHRLTRKLSRLR
jgi:flagellar hook assembly protein FlgD